MYCRRRRKENNKNESPLCLWKRETIKEPHRIENTRKKNWLCFYLDLRTLSSLFIVIFGIFSFIRFSRYLNGHHPLWSLAETVNSILKHADLHPITINSKEKNRLTPNQNDVWRFYFEFNDINSFHIVLSFFSQNKLYP